MIDYGDVIFLCWAAFILVWVISSFNIKRDVRGGYKNLWGQYWIFRVVAAAVIIFLVMRIGFGTAHYTNVRSVFERGIFPQILPLDWFGAALAVAGVSFAIWARVHLGRNWSPLPAVKEHHELVTSGPYAYVRHPIYTGMLLMTFGAALTGSIYGIGVFLFASIAFTIRIGKEEKIMLELFPDAYPEYQKRTKRLIPFVW